MARSGGKQQQQEKQTEKTAITELAVFGEGEGVSWPPCESSFWMCLRMEDDVRRRFKTFTVDIPKSFVFDRLYSLPLRGFSDIDFSYIPHHHFHVRQNQNQKLNLTYLATSPVNVQPEEDASAVIDSTLYCYSSPGIFDDTAKLLCLDLKEAYYHNNKAWYTISLPKHAISRSYPTAVGLCGRLFFFGGFYDMPNDGVPYGDVYDPSTGAWSVIQEPEGSSLRSHEFKIIPLEDDGSLLFINPCPYDFDSGLEDFHYKYDVSKAKWLPQDSGLYRKVRSFASNIVAVKALSSLYWIDKNGFLCAYDWVSSTFKCTPVIGLEHEVKFNMLDDLDKSISLVHVKEDLFCLLWSSVDWTYDPPDKTYIHATFLRIFKRLLNEHNIMDYTLFVVAVGCFGLHSGQPDSL